VSQIALLNTSPGILQVLTVSILAGVATWEREIMLARQREGIAKAKADGKYKGRPVSIDAYEVKRVARPS